MKFALLFILLLDVLLLIDKFIMKIDLSQPIVKIVKKWEKPQITPKQIFEKLLKNLPKEIKDNINFYVEDKEEDNAGAGVETKFLSFYGIKLPVTGYKVVIYTKYIKDLGKEEYIAAVIAHELAHIMLHHVDFPPSDKLHWSVNELNADLFGIYILEHAGYNGCSMYNHQKHILNVLGDYLLPGDHPSWAQRIYFSKLPSC